jgi:acyl-CoA-binding protein
MKGDVNTKKPGNSSSKDRRDKWDAWNDEKGKPRGEAASDYIDLVNDLLGENKEVNEYAQKLKDKDPELTEEEKALVNGLYKQATKGDCDTQKPKDKEKVPEWEDWNALKGKPKDEAAEEYIDIVRDLIKDKDKEEVEKYSDKLKEIVPELTPEE